MKKKIIIYSIIAITIVVLVTYGILKNEITSSNMSNQKNSNEIPEVKDEKIFLNVSSELDYSVDLSDPKVMEEISEYIAIVKIDSIDGVSNINNITNEYVSPYSYGKASIIYLLKGNLKSDKFNFIRLGGTMPFNEWIKGDEDPKKILELKSDSNLKNVPNKDILVKYQVVDDIDLEIGKTYLAYLTSDEYIKKGDFYITGLQYGLREIEHNEKSLNSNNLKKVKVKNNTTNKWENITDVVSTLK